MATVLKKTDIAIVGLGQVGAIIAKELTEVGLNVVTLERSPMRDTWPDGTYPRMIDELTYNIRHKLFQDPSKSTIIVRHNTSQQTVPHRQLTAFLPGTGVSGAGLHWSGIHFHVDPIGLQMRSHYEEHYGENLIPQDMIIQDFGVTYDELKPFFGKAEKVFGTSGAAWSIKGKVVGRGRGGNAFAPDRPDGFPLPTQKNTWSTQLFEKAALEVGYHPYNLPSANTSDSYTSPHGVQMGLCNFCGSCSDYVCYIYSRASPNVDTLLTLRQEKHFELRTNASVLKVSLADDKSRATGMIYIDDQGHEMERPAGLVIIGAFQFHNMHLILFFGAGKPYNPETGGGVVERNFAYQNMTTIKAIFDKDTYASPFIGADGNDTRIDDFNANNFGHGTAGFVGGSPFWVNQAGTKLIPSFPVPPGAPARGSKWKAAVTDTYTHRLSMGAHGTYQSYRQNYLDLDPNYKNVLGQPLLRVTFDWQENDIEMTQSTFDKMAPIAEAVKPKYILDGPKNASSHFDTITYQTTHMSGGAAMGEDPKTNAVNRYPQSWDIHNVLVIGASAFPWGLDYDPTGMVTALAYWSAKAIREQYLKNPGPPVQTQRKAGGESAMVIGPDA